MKHNIGITVAAVGLLFTIIGTTLFENNQYLRYGVVGFGVLLTVYGAYKADKERKLKRKSD